MTFASNVQPRRVLREKPSAWICDCDHFTRIHQGYETRCLDCGTTRPPR